MTDAVLGNASSKGQKLLGGMMNKVKMYSMITKERVGINVHNLIMHITIQHVTAII